MTARVETTRLVQGESEARAQGQTYLERYRAPFSLRCGALLIDYILLVAIIAFSTVLARFGAFLAAGVKEGAAMFQPACKLPTKGYYFRPTVFSGVSMSQRIAREEIFGPVLSVLTFRTLDEAVEKANNTAYGLSAGVWTDKGSRILKMSTELKAGVVWANTYNKFDPTSPFGGYKESGFGREGGRQGLLDYCKLV